MLELDFRTWLILERGNKAQLEVTPGIKPVPILFKGSEPVQFATPEQVREIAMKGLRLYFNHVDPIGFRYAKERFKFTLRKTDATSYGGLRITIGMDPIEKNRPGELEKVTPDHPMYDYYTQFNQGLTGYKTYKTPKDAISEIPADPNMVYRGMSWEEWQHIRRTGFIGSRGQWNLGQEGFTMFGDNPLTGVAYANGFAPPQYGTSFRKPSVVIAIPKSATISHTQDPTNVPDSEFGVKGKLSKDHIQSVWMLVPQKASTNSYVELVFQYKAAWDYRNDYSKDPMTGHYKLDVDHPRIGNANLRSFSSYAIRKLM